MLPRIKWMMQVCTIVAGQTAATESGRPFKPSQTRKNTSATPIFQLGEHRHPNLRCSYRPVSTGGTVCLVTPSSCRLVSSHTDGCRPADPRSPDTPRAALLHSYGP
jgi:hypothetical protein